MIVLYLESFENIFSNQISRYLKKRVFKVKPSQEEEFFARLRNSFFFRDSYSFPHIKTLLKASDYVFGKNPISVSNLNPIRSRRFLLKVQGGIYEPPLKSQKPFKVAQ